MEGAGDAKEPPAATAAAAAATTAGAATAITEEAPKPQSTVAGLAKEAAQLFHARSYQGCLLILHQLQLHNDEDPKVRSSSGGGSNSRCSCHMAGSLNVRCFWRSIVGSWGLEVDRWLVLAPAFHHPPSPGKEFSRLGLGHRV